MKGVAVGRVMSGGTVCVPPYEMGHSDRQGGISTGLAFEMTTKQMATKGDAGVVGMY